MKIEILQIPYLSVKLQNGRVFEIIMIKRPLIQTKCKKRRSYS